MTDKSRKNTPSLSFQKLSSFTLKNEQKTTHRSLDRYHLTHLVGSLQGPTSQKQNETEEHHSYCSLSKFQEFSYQYWNETHHIL